MFCPRCGTKLPDAGDCPACGQQRPNLDPPPSGAESDRNPARAVGCGLGGIVIGVLLGIGVGILICMGIFSNILNDFGKIFK